ncbi:MAG: hypothetical protein L0Z55_08085 [Planctomycetes bacterium]|nr:hypothetical protein [Planctomycetota bacterium]
MDRKLTRADFGLDDPDYDEVIADAEGSVGRTFEERAEMFIGIQEFVGAIWDNFTEEEMRRRLRIAEELDRLPHPWWSRMRPEAQP